MGDVLARIIGLIITTFVIAIIYGLCLTTMDYFTKPNYTPVASGHHAADTIFGLFGTVSDEIKRNEDDHPHATSVAYKIARPYAITADLAAVLGGKLEVNIGSLFHRAGYDVGVGR